MFHHKPLRAVLAASSIAALSICAACATDNSNQSAKSPDSTTTATKTTPKQAGDAPEPASPATSQIFDSPQRQGWKLQREETFDTPLNAEATAWTKDEYGPNSPWNVDEFDDDGEYFQNLGGEDFDKALKQQDVLRKRIEFGKDNWLTAEIAARDVDKNGKPEGVPSLDIADGMATINVPQWNGGLVLTGTDTLPGEYRLEYELKGLDFGGKKDGKWDYDDKTNGIGLDPECKTNFPWVRDGDYSQGGAQSLDPCKDPWDTVKQQNGYYLLSIMDYAKPAPHNNLFIHSHRKVGMDTYAVDGDWNDVYWACDGNTRKLIPYVDTPAQGINQIFFSGTEYRNPDFAYNEFIMPTLCGTYYGSQIDEGAEIVSVAELQPEILPKETYTIAIERTKDSYVTEVTGNFKYLNGTKTIRSERKFIDDVDGKPINHFNQAAEEYDGRFNHELTFTGPHGSFKKEMWPEGSAYPDNFVIGNPHNNYYEGTAQIDNLRLYTR